MSQDSKHCSNREQCFETGHRQTRQRPSGDVMEIKMTGIAAGWFSFGFGSRSMDNAYAIMVHSDGLREQVLAKKKPLSDARPRETAAHSFPANRLGGGPSAGGSIVTPNGFKKEDLCALGFGEDHRPRRKDDVSGSNHHDHSERTSGSQLHCPPHCSFRCSLQSAREGQRALTRRSRGWPTS